MVLAAIGSFGYKVFLLLHILAVITAFAPGFVWSLAAVRLKKAGKPVGPTIGEMAAGNTKTVHGPALVLAGIFGFAMVGMSDKVFEFKQAWISFGLGLWFVTMGVVFGLMMPAERKAAAGDQNAEKQISMFGGILHLLLLLLLIDMIWKPGLRGYI